MSQLKGVHLYHKRAHSPYKVKDDNDTRRWRNSNRESSLDPMKLDLIQAGPAFTGQCGFLRYSSPNYDTFMDLADAGDSKSPDTGSDTGEESGIDADETFAPAANHVPVELQNLWKRMEEQGFSIQKDIDHELPAQHTASSPEANKITAKASEYTMPPHGEDKPEYTTENPDLRYPTSSGYLKDNRTSKNAIHQEKFKKLSLHVGKNDLHR